ncbi:hypothetical protein FO519_000038 [Halicephalobus sp. NKZ332]|nr:hypothetical protein FO519_000038 [Halicephalobus sp. NKZ332]
MNKMFIVVFVAIIALLMPEADACPGLFGGGCCSPPPSPCGCGGRKKREALEPQVKTQESNPCPQKEWQKVIDQSLTGDSISSSFAVQGALFRTFESKFFVSCTEKAKISDVTFVSNGDGYCSHGNDKIWCQAVVLMG